MYHTAPYLRHLLTHTNRTTDLSGEEEWTGIDDRNEEPAVSGGWASESESDAPSNPTSRSASALPSADDNNAGPSPNLRTQEELIWDADLELNAMLDSDESMRNTEPAVVPQNELGAIV